MSSELFVVGVSWRKAPIALREKLAFRDQEIPGALAELLASPHIGEALIVSTCNRVEIYGSTAAGSQAGYLVAAAAARSFLAEFRNTPAENLAGDAVHELGELEAVRHVFRVACALDSMVVGEAQILGQLKTAYGLAVRAGATGPILDRFMQRAFAAAKRVRHETGIARGAANVSSVAVELAGHVFGDLAGKSVLILGAGKMSALAVRHLRVGGAGAIFVTNRSSDRAAALAGEVDGLARPWEKLEELVADADVVISSTGASEPVLSLAAVRRVMRKRRYRPLLLIDIGVPRDVEPAIGKLDGVYLFDIDDLKRVVDTNLKERAREAQAAERVIEAEVQHFRRWLQSQRVVPTIRSLRRQFRQVASAEADRVIRSLRAEHTPEQRDQMIRRLADVIANKLLHMPMSALKSHDPADIASLVAAAQRLFDLPSESGADKAAALPRQRRSAATSAGDQPSGAERESAPTPTPPDVAAHGRSR